MLRLKNVNEQQGAQDQEFKWQCGPTLSSLRNMPNIEVPPKKKAADKKPEDQWPRTDQGEAFLSSVDQKTIDYEEYYKMDMAGRGTGYDAFGKAINFARELKRKHDESINHVTDTGFAEDMDESMYKRLLKALLARDGIDIDDTRDKFTI